jgi:hypothetical protein
MSNIIHFNNNRKATELVLEKVSAYCIYFLIMAIVGCSVLSVQSTSSQNTIKNEANIMAMISPIIYVAGDGSGDFNCDGIDDHVEINQALDYVGNHTEYTTVHLKGANTYWINETIYISGNTILEGDSTAIIKLINKAGWWTKFKPLIGQKGTMLAGSLGDPGTRTDNITIRGFEIDGNKGNQSEPDGDSYYTIIQLQNCYNVTINDMYLHHNRNDAIRFVNDTIGAEVNSVFFNNRILKPGHDGLYILNVNKFKVYNNHISSCRTDAGIRTQYCNEFKIYSNIISNSPTRPPSGGAAIQIQSGKGVLLNDAEIYANSLRGYFGWYGIWLNVLQGSAGLGTYRDVHIHHNIIRAFNEGGVGIQGFHNTLIEHNTIDANIGGGVLFTAGSPGWGVSGFVTIVRNNNITDSRNGGYGLDNRHPGIHSFVSDYNFIYGNEGGHYNNVSSTTDFYIDPLCASSGN